MIRHMVATKLADYLPGLTVSNISLPYWNIHVPSLLPRADERICDLMAEQHVPFEQLRHLSEAGAVTRIHWHGYGQRLENFPAKSVCDALFQTDDRIGVELSDDCLLCPIRAGEILDAIHPGYTIVPVEFYEDIVERTGFSPVFMGQLADNEFVRRLRSRFPKARYLPQNDALEDFQTIRKARNIVLPVSTFAWLAAWLSNAAYIALPVFGIFNPRLFALHDLLPIGEDRYQFFQFPERHAVPLSELEETHKLIKGKWHQVRGCELAPTTL